MSRVITFSRVFPSYHPRKGESTYFVEQIQNSLCAMSLPMYAGVDPPMYFLDSLTKKNVGYKHHTIRAGHRWKAGDWFSPRVWSGKPYNSKQIQFAPDIQIRKVLDFEFIESGFKVNGKLYDGEIESHHDLLEEIAKNDGLTKRELIEWFNTSEDFIGQIISWNENIEY